MLYQTEKSHRVEKYDHKHSGLEQHCSNRSWGTWR